MNAMLTSDYKNYPLLYLKYFFEILIVIYFLIYPVMFLKRDI